MTPVVMLCTHGNVRDFVKVLDFGLVKDAAADVKLTNDRVIAGTPLYIAPESIVSPDTVGPAADCYALGCVAFFLLTRKPPFPGDNLVQVCADHIHRAPDAPSAQAPSRVSPPLDALTRCCSDASPRPPKSGLA